MSIARRIESDNPDRQQRQRNTLSFYFDPVPDIVRQDVADGKLIPLDAMVMGRCLRQRRADGTSPGHECTKEGLAADLGKCERTIQRSFARLKTLGHIEHVPDTSDPIGYRVEFPSLRPPRLAPGTGVSPPPDTRVSPGETAVSPPPSHAEGTRPGMQTETETEEFRGEVSSHQEEQPQSKPQRYPRPPANMARARLAIDELGRRDRVLRTDGERFWVEHRDPANLNIRVVPGWVAADLRAFRPEVMALLAARGAP